MAKPLVIVEASGKTAFLQRALKSIGLDANIMATVGHVFDNPQRLIPMALDGDLKETAYAPRADREALIGKLRQAAVAADRVYLAMDDDQEGDVIAWDMAKLLVDNNDNLFRVRLRALSEDELKKAFFGELSRDFEVGSYPGTARRIVDRAIGATFSEFGTPPVYTGRVQSSLLAQLDEEHPVIGEMAVQARLSSGEVFWAKIPVTSLDQIHQIEAYQDAVAKGRGEIVSYAEIERAAAQPWGFEEIIAEASERLGIAIESAERAFQDAYEKGKVSYPRARRNGFSVDGSEIAAALARENRCAFERGRLPLRDEGRSGSVPHESPRPLSDDLLLGRPLNLMDSAEAVAVLVARNTIACGQVVKEKQARISANGMDALFCYTERPPMRNWKESDSVAGYRAYPMETALLRYMAKHELGRPSTIVGHVQKFLQRELVAGQGQTPFALTAKGRHWLEHARSMGITKDTSRQIESAIEMEGRLARPNETARQILGAHGMLSRVEEAVRREVKADQPVCDAEFVM